MPSQIDKAIDLLDNWTPIHADDRFCDSVLQRISGELESGAIRRQRISSLAKAGMLAILIFINLGTFGYLITTGNSAKESRQEQMKELADTYSIEYTNETLLTLSE